jgi:hypothetical protein
MFVIDAADENILLTLPYPDFITAERIELTPPKAVDKDVTESGISIADKEEQSSKA